MIIVNQINTKTIACRGGLSLGILRRILFTLRLPMPFISFASDDKYLVKPASVSHFTFVADEIATARKKASDEREAANQEAAGRMVQIPGMRIPSRH